MTLSTPTVRDLRLASGLVLFTYVALHLVNHALGLASVAVAERGLNVAVRVWHSLPGTIVLYGAAATHIALALAALYRRRTLRMPPLEVLRIALGLGIPLLLIGHAVNTRLAWEGYRLSPEYVRVVWALWASDNEGTQLALLVPGWLHGCLGVNFAFGHRRWYRRLRPLLFGAALLLPVLGGLGFLAMGKELSADPAHRDFLDSNIGVDAATRIALTRTRDALLTAYFALIATVFVAREIRTVVERRRNAVVTIAYPRRNARVPAGWTVLEASRSHHIPHLSMCGGRARCSTCRVRVTTGDEHCPAPEPAERATLARIGAPAGVRLACQLRPTGNISVVPLLPALDAPVALERAGPVAETELAILLVEWRNRARFARGHLPQDVVYLSGLFNHTVAGAVQATGGTVSETRIDRTTAVFGLDAQLANACAQALEAARSIDVALRDLRRRFEQEFGVPAEFAVFVHAGHGALGGTSASDSRQMLVAGDVVDGVEAMSAGLPGDVATALVSAPVLETAKLPLAGLAWQTVELPGRATPLQVAPLPARSPAQRENSP